MSTGSATSGLDSVALGAVAGLTQHLQVADVVCSAVSLGCDVIYSQVGSLVRFTLVTRADITMQRTVRVENTLANQPPLRAVTALRATAALDVPKGLTATTARIVAVEPTTVQTRPKRHARPSKHPYWSAGSHR